MRWVPRSAPSWHRTLTPLVLVSSALAGRTVGAPLQPVDRGLHYGLPVQHPNRPLRVRGAQPERERAQIPAHGSLGATERDELPGAALPAGHGAMRGLSAEPLRLSRAVLQRRRAGIKENTGCGVLQPKWWHSSHGRVVQKWSTTRSARMKISQRSSEVL